MRELSLFTGAGGGILGTHLLGWTPIGYVEWDDYCQRVLAARIADGLIPAAPIFGDVREFAQSGAAEQYRGFADVVSAGFPCQPFSIAGKRRAAGDSRNMWPATLDVIRIVRPEHIMLENVPGILASYAARVTADLAALGYVGRTACVSASGTGAPHRRLRWWLVANANHGQRCSGQELADAEHGQQSPSREIGRMGRQSIKENDSRPTKGKKAWPVEPNVGRVAHGVASRVDRLKSLGNGQVPRVVAAAWELLS